MTFAKNTSPNCEIHSPQKPSVSNPPLPRNSPQLVHQKTTSSAPISPKLAQKQQNPALTFFRKSMDPTLQFLPTPTPTPRISPCLRNRRARLTPDTCIPAVIQFQPRNPLCFRILSDPRPIPIRQHANLLHLLARRSRMILDLLQPRPSRRLLTPQPRKPPANKAPATASAAPPSSPCSTPQAAQYAASQTAPQTPERS